MQLTALRLQVQIAGALIDVERKSGEVIAEGVFRVISDNQRQRAIKTFAAAEKATLAACKV